MTRLTDTATVTLTCAACQTRATAQAGHLANLLAVGPWTCDRCRLGAP